MPSPFAVQASTAASNPAASGAQASSQQTTRSLSGRSHLAAHPFAPFLANVSALLLPLSVSDERLMALIQCARLTQSSCVRLLAAQVPEALLGLDERTKQYRAPVRIAPGLVVQTCGSQLQYHARTRRGEQQCQGAILWRAQA